MSQDVLVRPRRRAKDLDKDTVREMLLREDELRHSDEYLAALRAVEDRGLQATSEWYGVTVRLQERVVREFNVYPLDGGLRVLRHAWQIFPEEPVRVERSALHQSQRAAST